MPPEVDISRGSHSSSHDHTAKPNAPFPSSTQRISASAPYDSFSPPFSQSTSPSSSSSSTSPSSHFAPPSTSSFQNTSVPSSSEILTDILFELRSLRNEVQQVKTAQTTMETQLSTLQAERDAERQHKKTNSPFTPELTSVPIRSDSSSSSSSSSYSSPSSSSSPSHNSPTRPISPPFIDSQIPPPPSSSPYNPSNLEPHSYLLAHTTPNTAFAFLKNNKGEKEFTKKFVFSGANDNFCNMFHYKMVSWILLQFRLLLAI